MSMRQSKIELGTSVFSCFLEKLNRTIIWIFLLKKLVEVELEVVGMLVLPLRLQTTLPRSLPESSD